MNADFEEAQPAESPGHSTAWMITFADLVSLMLTFFVLLFSMSSVKVDKWDAMIDALAHSLKPSTTATVAPSTAQFNIASIFRKQSINLDYLAGVLEKSVSKDPLLRSSQIMRMDDRLVIALPGDLLFQPGRAVMTARAREALFSLGSVIRNIGNQIGVNGHSDPVAPSGGEYTSNWELSVARAIAVTNALKRAGYTEDIVAFGFSDSHFSHLPDMPDDQKSLMARRVDVVVFPTAGGA